MVNVDPIAVIKYLLIGLGLSVAFNNMLYCIEIAAPAITYVLYVGVIFVGAILLVLIHSNVFLCGLLAVMGLVTIYLNPNVSVSWGLIFMIFAKRIADNMFFSIFVYISTAVAVFGMLIAAGVEPVATINTISVYPVVYFIDFLLYNKREGDNNK